jgi:hypothetical protein
MLSALVFTVLGAPYYVLDNRMESFVRTQFTASYSSGVADTYCPKAVPIASHRMETVRMAQCKVVCAADPAAAGCQLSGEEGFHPLTDDMICGDLADAKDLCTSLPECSGVTFEDGSDRALLNSLACYELGGPEGSHPGYTFYTKTFGDMPACELGSGAEISGSPYPEVNGVYVDCEPGDAPNCVPHKTLVQLTDNDGRSGKGSKIVWHHTNCGWAVKRDISTPASPVVVTPPTCVDNDAAAAFAFDMPPGEPICSIAGVDWDAGYCAHPLFYALCHASCGCKTGQALLDMEAAAVAEYITLVGADKFSGCGMADCADPIETVLCPTSCAGRRLAQVSEGKLGGKLGGKFRSAMASLTLERSGKGRRLGLEEDLDYEEVYNTFGIPGPGNPMCTTRQGQVVSTPITSGTDWHFSMLSSTLYPSGIFYDLALWHDPVPGTMSLKCPGAEITYETATLDPTLDGAHGNMYCPLNNIAVMYNDDYEIVRNGCWQKCGPRVGSFNSTDNEMVDGKNTWCSGYGKDFTEHTNALCLPREECERLCTKHEECHSIDMHRVLPQCYLNTYACTDMGLWERVSEFDIIAKIQTPDETTSMIPGVLEPITTDALRDTYMTMTGFGDAPDKTPWDRFDPPIHARRRGIAYTEIAKPRWACEQNCSYSSFRSMSDWCMGFVFESKCTVKYTDDGVDVFNKRKCPDEGTCKYFGAGFVEHDMHEMNYTFESEPGSSGSYYNLQIMESVVVRNKFKPCVVTVDMAGPEYDGKYSKMMCDGDTVFQFEDNSKRLKYRTDLECDGWVLEENVGASVVEIFSQCTDDAVAASLFVGSLDENTPTDSGLRFVCETLWDEGACSFTDTVRPKFFGIDPKWDSKLLQNQFTAVIRGLCSHTCLPIDEKVIAGNVYYQQQMNTSMGTHFKGDPPVPINIGSPANDPIPGGDLRHDSTCHGDDHVGAEAFLRIMSNADAFPDLAYIDEFYVVNYCGNFSWDPLFYNYTHSPCHWHPWARVWSSLCVETCKDLPAPQPPVIPVIPTDEVDDEGAQWPYRQRRLQQSAVDRGPSTQPATYLDPCPDTGFDGAEALLTWMNGSSDARHGVDKCTDLAFGEAAYQRLARQFFEPEPYIDDKVLVERKCENMAPCPELMTCVLAPMRFDKALYAKREAYGITRTRSISSYPLDAEITAFLNNFIPQVLITDTRAEAHIVGAKFEITGKVSRNVPGATEVMLHGDTPREHFGDYMVMALAPSSESNHMVYARTEFGRAYESPPGYSDWVTDVIRIERFVMTPSGYAPLTDDFVIDVFAGMSVKMLHIFGFVDGNSTAIPLQGEVVPHYDVPGVFVVKINSQLSDMGEPIVDFIGVVDIDECLMNPCDPHADCHDKPGGLPETAICTCKDGYVGDGRTCALEQDQYESGKDDYYLRLYHTDTLKFGWRVSEIKMYLDEDCMQELPFWQAGLQYPPPPGCDPNEYPPGPACTKTYLDITRMTNVYTGVYAKSHYPGEWFEQYWNGNLFDGQPWTSWWSSSLELNPELKDGDAVTIEWLVAGMYDVKCVKIFQEEHHASSKLMLERGPVAEAHVGKSEYGWNEDKEGTSCLMEQSMKYMDHPKPRCKPTVTAFATFEMWDTMMTEGTFKHRCGTPNTQIFGEILRTPATNAAGWYGSYANNVDVESPCHCQALCIAHLTEGCRNYKYYDNHGIRHCYLQSSTFGPGEGYYGVDSSSDYMVAEGWTSGYIGRIMTGFKSTMGVPGAAFNITVTGVGLPFSAVTSKSGAPRQRIKIVPADAECKAPIPPEVQGIGCTKSSFKIDTTQGPIVEDIYTVCSAKPVDASPEFATFMDLKITSKEMDAEYKVCYCAGNCFHPTTYEVLPGKILVPGSSYLFSTDPPVVYRKVVKPNGPMPITVKVERPLFGGDAVADGWELKIIRAYKGCGVEPEESKVVPSTSKLADGSGYLGTVLNPDTVLWSFTLEFEEDDAGDWAVCFREAAGKPLMLIPSMMGKYLSVLPVAPDIEHTTGIFHNSRFSALSMNMGGTISVKGFRLPVPTDSKIAVSKGTTCGDLATFEAVPLLPPPSDDVVPPTLLSVYPVDPDTTGGRGVGIHQALTFTFSEPITTAGCSGHLAIVPLRWNDTSTWTYIPCGKLVTIGKQAILLPKDHMFGESESYFFRFARGLLTDMAGNPMPFTSTEAMYEVTASANFTGEELTPVIMMTTPCYDCESDVDVLTIEFSEPVNPVVGKLVTVIDCGPDLKCTPEDYPIDYFDVTSLKVSMVNTPYYMAAGYNASSSATVSFSIANLAMYRKYKVIIPAESFFDTGNPGGTLEEVVPSAPYEIIFTRVPDVKPVLHTVPASKTETDAYTFLMQIPDTIMDPELSVCYCDANLDMILEDLNDDAVTLKMEDKTKCTGMTPPVDEVPDWPVKKAIASHVCADKCDVGCTGPMCFCDGNDGTASTTTLCLPPTLCREACDALGGACLGITVADGKPQCELLAPDTVCSEADDWQSFKKHAGTACTHVEDFKERAGLLTVTKRVQVGIDYVVEPGKDMAIEVTAPADGRPTISASCPSRCATCRRGGENYGGVALSESGICENWCSTTGYCGVTDAYISGGTDCSPCTASAALSRWTDRIMVIDCEGVCGISGPSKAATVDTFKNPPAEWESTGDVLHYTGVSFESGGTFKLCFCDSYRWPSGLSCNKNEDFSIEVGTVHSSGVSCLVAQPELQKASCVPHMPMSSGDASGLRCYKDYDAPFSDFAVRRLEETES